ncbi:MAG: type I-A CRISPR-associated protein Cas5a [Candidatus Methanomethylicia archaeon]
MVNCKPSSLLSIKLPKSYQSQPSFLLPPPSTIFGVYARGIGVALDLPQFEAQKLAMKTLINVSSNSLMPSTRSGALIRRWRIESNGEVTIKSDAMVREFIHTSIIRLYFVVNEKEFKYRNPEQILYLCGYSCSRIGDTESIVSPFSIRVVRVSSISINREVKLAGYVPEEVIKEVVSGDYTVTEMPTMYDAKKYKPYILPLSAREKHYIPSDLFVRFKDDVSCIEVDGGYVNV